MNSLESLLAPAVESEKAGATPQRHRDKLHARIAQRGFMELLPG
jgi:hypothetical protein